MREAEPLARKIKNGPDIHSVRPLFGYPTKRYSGLRDIWLKETLVHNKLEMG